MIAMLKIYNPVFHDYINLNINEYSIDYFKWIRLKQFKDDNDIINILYDIIIDLNCEIIYDYGRPMITSSFLYNDKISEYFYYLNKLNNHILYNKYLDRLITRHIDNIIFEYLNPIGHKVDKIKNKSKKKKVKNEFVKFKTKDLFTNKDIYIYENFKTGEKITSEDNNLLEELNKKKKKEKRVKEIGVPITSMMFNFNIKK